MCKEKYISLQALAQEYYLPVTEIMKSLRTAGIMEEDIPHNGTLKNNIVKQVQIGDAPAYYLYHKAYFLKLLDTMHTRDALKNERVIVSKLTDAMQGKDQNGNTLAQGAIEIFFNHALSKCVTEYNVANIFLLLINEPVPNHIKRAIFDSLERKIASDNRYDQQDNMRSLFL